MKTVKIPKVAYTLFLLWMGTTRLYAQIPLTWDACVKEATEHNPDLLSAEQSLKASDDTHIASLGQFFPQISFNASINRSGSGGLDDALNSPNYGQNSNLSLNAQQDIFSGFRDFASVDQSNAQLDLARAQLTQAKAQLSHDLKIGFYQLLFAQKQIELLQAIADRNKANQDLVEMNFKGGTDNKGSLLQAQATHAESLFEVNQAKRNLRVSQRQLAQLLGRNQLEDIEVQGEFETLAAPDTPPDFLQLLSQTPAHLESLAQLHLAESGYLTARSVFLPTLSANASLFQQGYNFEETQPGWSAGLELSLPLFTGGKDLFNFKSAEESQSGAEYNLKSTDLKTETALETSYASLVNAVEDVRVQRSFLQAAQTREEIGKAEYLNGLLIFQNWDQLESNLTSQQKAELTSLLNLETTEADWELTQGKGVMP